MGELTETTGNAQDDELDFWMAAEEGLDEFLPIIDEELARTNMPISERPHEAFKLVQKTMLKISDHVAFMWSDVYGRFLVIISDWYRRRFGDAVAAEKDRFVASILVHGTPFVMRVPKYFNTPDDDPSCVWIGFPATVQAEENPLDWILERDVIDGLSEYELIEMQRSATAIANLVRSIGFDVWRLASMENPSIAALATAIRGDLQSSALSLCERDDGSLRSSAWLASQATEKALKVYLERKGHNAPRTHDLFRLASLVEKRGSRGIDRSKLALVPSGKEAIEIRYEGHVSLADAFGAYDAALAIVSQLVFDTKPDEKFNLREARFKMKRAPWFKFDVEAFRESIRRNE